LNVLLQLLGWLAEKLPSYKKLPAEFQDCVPYLYASLEDRNADVRKKAQEAVLPFMIHASYEVMARLAAKAKVVYTLCQSINQSIKNLKHAICRYRVLFVGAAGHWAVIKVVSNR